jgi:putative nucleotidyltransferase with HDIG domain
VAAARIDAEWREWIEAGRWRSAGEPLVHMPAALAADILPLVTNCDISVLRLARVISRDQVLASRVLRLANSAHYGALQEVTTVNDAIVRMGTGPVRNVVFAVCFASRMHGGPADGPQRRRLADHAIGTACMARALAEQAGLNLDEAFLHGLLHDIGKLLILELADAFTRGHGAAPSDAAVSAVTDSAHASLGAELLAAWNLPVSLREPVRHHHLPGDSIEYRDESAVLYLADRLSHRYGFGCEPGELTTDLLSDPESGRLHLTPAWLERMDAAAPSIFEAARDVLA